MANKTYKEIYGELIKSGDDMIGKVFAKGIADNGIEGFFDEEYSPYFAMIMSYYQTAKKLIMDQAEKMDEMDATIKEIKKLVEKK
jgi:hypothetical protein